MSKLGARIAQAGENGDSEDLETEPWILISFETGREGPGLKKGIELGGGGVQLLVSNI